MGEKTSCQSQAQNSLARFLSLLLMDRGGVVSMETKSALLLVGIASLKLCFQVLFLYS